MIKGINAENRRFWRRPLQTFCGVTQIIVKIM